LRNFVKLDGEYLFQHMNIKEYKILDDGNVQNITNECLSRLREVRSPSLSATEAGL